MLFDPALFARPDFARRGPLAPGSSLRRWLKRLCLIAFLAVGAAAAVLLFAPLI